MLSVLVVDDDADLLEMVEMVLGNYAMEVNTLRSGSGLLDKLREVKPDIVVMDIYLGDSDGRILCRHLKNSAQYADLPVILYSAGVIPPESIRTSQADEFISKPFQIDNLVQKIKVLAQAS